MMHNATGLRERTTVVVEFDDFRLDISKRSLTQARRSISIPPKAFDILVALITRQERAVSKEELLQIVWPNVNVEEGTLNQQIFLLRRALGDKSANPRFIITVPKYGFRWLSPLSRVHDNELAVDIRKVAVLQLIDVSPDRSGDYFADGLTEAMISTLGKVRALRVLGRTSAARFRDSTTPIPEISQTLGVDGILEGSVCRVGDRLRVDVRLIESQSELQRWSESYERDAADVLIVQREIAQAVAVAIGATVTPAEHATLAAGHAVNQHAHDACLRAHHHMNKQAPSEIEPARRWLERAVEIDPSYAPAHSGLAHWFASAVDHRIMSTVDAVDKGQVSAEKALDCDPTCSDAYAALGRLAFLDLKPSRAIASLETALRLDQTNVAAARSLALFLSHLGRFADARRRIEVALAEDSLSPRAHAAAAQVYYVSSQYELAKQHAAEALSLDPYFAQAEYSRALALIEISDLVGAERALRRAKLLLSEQPHPAVNSLLLFVRARQGHVEEVEEAVRGLLCAVESGEASAADLATVRVALGQHSAAIDALELALARREFAVNTIAHAPILSPLRREPRFQQLVVRIAARESS